MKDVMIVGAGPAGMTAALYAHAAGLSVLLIEKGVCGGQMAVSTVIDNYPGVGRITGYELSEKMQKQVEDCGIVTVYSSVQRIERLSEGFRVICDGGDEYTGRCVIIANGVTRRQAGFIGEREYLGKGVSYCAVCDGGFFKGEDVCVVGGGNSALEEAIYLAGICKTVYVIHRRDSFRGDEKYVRAVEASQGIKKLMSCVPVRVGGDGKVSYVEIRDEMGKTSVLKVSGVFVAVGLVPDNARFADTVSLTEKGYIKASEDCMTDTEGIFVCGDTREKKLRQIATAVSDGAAAATAAAEYLRRLGTDG